MANYKLTNSDKFYIEQHPKLGCDKLAALLGCHPTTILKYRNKIKKKAGDKSEDDPRQVEEPVETKEENEVKIGSVDQFKKNGETQAIGMSRAAGEMIDDIMKKVNTEPDPAYTKRFKPKI